MRLGGQAVLSLAELPQTAISTTTSSGLEIDWRGLLAAAGFDQAEAMLVVAHRLEVVPRTELAAYLRWPARTVETIRRRVSRKLARLRIRGDLDLSEVVVILRVDPSRTMALERFASGVQVWGPRG